MNYRLQTVSSDGFPIDEIFPSMEDAKRFCRAQGLEEHIKETKCQEWQCEFCGFYIAEKPRCNQCELE